MHISGLHHQGIFRVSGSQVEINNFRESFERGEDPLADVTDASDINSVAGVLKLYLRELREPLFPIIYFEHFMELAREYFYLCVELIFFFWCSPMEPLPFFFFYWHYNPLWVLTSSVIFFHSALSLHNFLHHLIPIICISSSMSSIHLFLGLMLYPNQFNKMVDSSP